MNERRATMPEFHLPRIGESVLRIIKFYRDADRPEEVAKWQAQFNQLGAEAKRSLVVNLPAPAIAAGNTGVSASLRE